MIDTREHPPVAKGAMGRLCEDAGRAASQSQLATSFTGRYTARPYSPQTGGSPMRRLAACLAFLPLLPGCFFIGGYAYPKLSLTPPLMDTGAPADEVFAVRVAQRHEDFSATDASGHKRMTAALSALPQRSF